MSNSLHARQLGKYTAWAIGALLLVSSFQNCSPMTGSGPATDASSSTGTPTTPPSATQIACESAAYTAPVWGASSGGASQNTMSIGYAIQNAMPATTQATYAATQVAYTAGNVGTPNCKATNMSNNSLTANCKMNGAGAITLTVSAGTGAECLSGTATFDLTLDDGCKDQGFNSATPPSKAFSVSYTSSCVAESDLAATAPQAQSQLGTRAAISGGTAVFTAPAYSDASTNRLDVGAAYVYTQNGATWSQSQMIVPPAASAPAGSAITGVALNGNLLVLGAPGTVASAATGAVYVYQLNGTTATLLQTLTPPTGAKAPLGTWMFYGYSVAIIGANTIAVGGFQSNSQTTTAGESGQVYIYTTANGTTWTYAQTLEPSDPVNYLNFGASLSSSGNYLVVGAPMNPAFETPTAPGNVYVFSNAGGTFAQTAEIKGSTAVTGGSKSQLQFGVSVATNGTDVAVGATAYDQTGENAGAVYTGHFGAAFIYTIAGSADTSYGSAVLSEAAAVTQNGKAGVNFLMGSSVAFSGTNLYVGEQGYPTSAGAQTGAVVEYVSGTSGIAYRLAPMAANLADNEEFGINISVGGNFISVGAPGRTAGNQTNAGMGFVMALP